MKDFIVFYEFRFLRLQHFRLNTFLDNIGLVKSLSGIFYKS